MISLTIEQRKAIDLAKEGLVVAAEQFLKDGGIRDIDTKKLGDSQFRNLLAVAMETESPMVVVNFLRYQVGRKQGWNAAHGGTTLGERLIEEIEKEGKAIRTALDVVAPGADGHLRQIVQIELVRHFIGFAARYRKFVEFEKKRAAGEANGDDS